MKTALFSSRQEHKKNGKKKGNQKNRSSRRAGEPPGTLLHIGPSRTENVVIDVISYTKEAARTFTAASAEDLAGSLPKDGVTWVNVSGVHDPDCVRTVGNLAGMHPLYMEDVMDTTKRPKVEISRDALFISMKMMMESSGSIEMEQVSLFLGENLVITFQEAPGDVFAPIRRRIETAGSQLRLRNADFLAYALTDVIVDRYFSVIEEMDTYIEPLEEQVLSDPSPEHSYVIHQVRNDLIQVRKLVWPMREVLRSLQRDSAEQCDLIQDETRMFFGDVYDHVIQVMDQIESFRDILSGISDLYMNSISLRMNNIMKVLTLIATIFIPLTFIAGIYGMNFTYMPELQWRWGYAAVWVVMVIAALVMLLFFRKKHWL